MYRGLTQSAQLNSNQATSFMASKGMNTRIFPQLVSLDFAQLIRNYVPYGDGELVKRAGKTTLASLGGTAGFELQEPYTNTVDIVGLQGSVYAFDNTTGNTTLITNSLSSAGSLDGTRYGDYFFVVNGVDYLQRIYQQMTYTGDIYSPIVSVRNILTVTVSGGAFADAETLTFSGGATANIVSVSTAGAVATMTVNPTNTTNVTVGQTVTSSGGGTGTVATINDVQVGDRLVGQTSGARGTVLEDNGSRFVLGDITGTFVNGESLVSAVAASSIAATRATATSAVTYGISEVSAAPIGSIVEAMSIDKAARLFIGDLIDDPSAVQASDVDDGSSPPFATWANDSTVTGGFKINYRRAGRVRSIINYGDAAVAMCQFGYYAFDIEQLEISGSLAKRIHTIASILNQGGERNAINTEKGILSASEAGITQIVNLGRGDVPFSEQAVEITNNLADDYFKLIDFSNADLVYNQKDEIVYCTCARDSERNNLIIGYSFKQKALFEITGWNIARMINRDQVIYGADSTTGKIYKLFDGSTDDGNPISTVYEQEIRFGDLASRVDLMEVYLNGQLSDGTSIDITLSRYDRTGAYDANKFNYTWTLTNAPETDNGGGYNGPYNGGYGAGIYSDLTNQQSGFKAKMRRCNRVILQITSGDKLPHIINYVQAKANVTTMNRNRLITKN